MRAATRSMRNPAAPSSARTRNPSSSHRSRAALIGRPYHPVRHGREPHRRRSYIHCQPPSTSPGDAIGAPMRADSMPAMTRPDHPQRPHAAAATASVTDFGWTPVMQAAWDHVRTHEEAAIFNHSVRAYLLAQAQASETDAAPDAETLFLACIFHDCGTAAVDPGPERFEVEGADAAARFLADAGWDAERIDEVWQAIALHTTPGIAERRGPVPRLTRLGVLADFGAGAVSPAVRRDVEREYPRLEIERVLSDAVVRQAIDRPEKAPSGSWAGAMRAAFLADPSRPGLNPAF
ncbi:HD domain-containing protein [Microbacterium lushaniae]|uniref:HD domain-containing protein n=2 Tax=Microbacterium lushaniae TaxID=2614639 RepID=A0A5J6L0H4_9MICO|nr:HD domain-containing protein [Microbacterium lushaniae]